MHQPAWSTASSSYASGTVKSAKFHLDPGFRITGSYYNAPKYWEVRAGYTHLISRGSDSAGVPGGSGKYLTGTWPQITLQPLVHAHSHAFFNYNIFDLTIDRVFITNPHLRLRMTGGLSLPWIEQDWKIHYFDSTGGNTTIRNRWHYVGAGIKMGLSGDWYWGNNVYITGLSSFGMFMGSYSNHSKQTTTFQPTGSENPMLPVRNSSYSDARGAFCAQFSIGPSWQKNIRCNRIEIYAGYELTGWFNLQEIRRSSGGVPTVAKETWMSTSMITLQGLTTRVTFDF
jgi:hypothetical protein